MSTEETKSNIYIPRDCMNEIITQLKLLNTKKFVIVISEYPGEPRIEHLDDVKLFIVEANNEIEALESISKRFSVQFFEILENMKSIFPKKTNLSEIQLELMREFKELKKTNYDIAEKRMCKFIEKYKNLLFPILINQDTFIKIEEIF